MYRSAAPQFFFCPDENDPPKYVADMLEGKTSNLVLLFWALHNTPEDLENHRNNVISDQSTRVGSRVQVFLDVGGVMNMTHWHHFRGNGRCLGPGRP